jgi:hypothetical protein
MFMLANVGNKRPTNRAAVWRSGAIARTWLTCYTLFSRLLPLNHNTAKNRINEFMINETILAARALSHNEVHNVVGDNTEPVVPKTKPTVKSLANENHFIFLNMMPINKDKMIGIKNQIITSVFSIFAYNRYYLDPDIKGYPDG